MSVNELAVFGPFWRSRTDDPPAL